MIKKVGDEKKYLGKQFIHEDVNYSNFKISLC